MIRLLFDGTAMQGTALAKAHGGSEYAKYLYRTMIQQGKQFDVVLYSDRPLDEETSFLLQNKHRGNVIHVNSKEELYSLIIRNEYDRFFSALPYEYYDYPCKCEFWGVIHGLRTIELPWDKYKYKYYSKWHKRIFAKILGNFSNFVEYWRKKHIKEINRLISIPNSHFITVSNHSKYSMLHYFPALKKEDIDVFYSPFSSLEEKSDGDVFPNYFLMVSGNRYEKNVYRAVKTFDQLFSKGQLDGFKIKITGVKDTSLYNHIINKDCFEFLDYVTYAELENLFQHAYAFVYPSLNEGFGYPPLQAMSAGVPVIASSATSIPEVCGDAACYFSPTSTDDLASRILWLTNDQKYRVSLVSKGFERVDQLLNIQKTEIPKLIDKIFN